tara:strand:- start:114 stop:557 length:444 start_codon:yes stop_codon:yes gene_type:complete
MYCENCRIKFWKYISDLPNEVCSIIFSYIRSEEKVFLNKEYYEQFHYLISSKISSNNYDNYIRDIIRNDASFVLNQLLNENYERWLVKRKRIHKNIIYNNYTDYMLGLCLESESTKCRELINEFYNTKGLSKNLHKKNRSNNKRWTQ